MRGWQVMVMVIAVGCGDNRNGTVATDSATGADGQSAAEHGQYIMNILGACTFCHTPLLPNGMRDTTRLFAGVDCFFDADPNDANVGCLSSRNLTNDATGLKNVTDDAIKNAFRNGMRTDGKYLAPVMPYWVFHNMSDEDASDIVAYLRTLPPVDHQVQANQPPWSLYNDGMIPPAPFIDPDVDLPVPNGGANNASAIRGRYLATMSGLCVDCHTPERPNTPPFTLPLDFTKSMAGGRVFPKEALGLIDPSYPAFITTRNLTPDATGLMGWTKDQIKTAIAKGKDRNGNAVCAATHGTAISPYAALTDRDLDDIAEYVYRLSPTVNDTGADCAGPPVP